MRTGEPVSVARFGGEEFAVLLIHADEETALPTARRLRGAVEKENWQGQRITVTVGVACLTAGTRDATDLIAVADAALYRGKARGRNRVVRHANLP